MIKSNVYDVQYWDVDGYTRHWKGIAPDVESAIRKARKARKGALAVKRVWSVTVIADLSD